MNYGRGAIHLSVALVAFLGGRASRPAIVEVSAGNKYSPVPPDGSQEDAGQLVEAVASSSDVGSVTDRREIVIEPSPTIQQPVTVCEAFAILSKALRDYPLYDGDDQSFAEKYRNATAEQLQASLVIVRKRQESERQRIVDERIANGLYEERVLTGDEEGPRVQTTPGGGPVSFGFVTEHLDGYSKSKVTYITGEEYPDYRNLELEWLWLMKQVRVLGVSDCAR